MIIGLSGYAGTGKDTVAAFIQELRPDFVNKKFAGPLKKIASILTGIPDERFEDQDFKSSYLGSEWDQWVLNKTQPERMTVREFLQRLGTEAIRSKLHSNAWVNALMAEYKPGSFFPEVPAKDHAKMPSWIISDVRFYNEAQAIVDRGGVVIRIDRPGFGPINNHPSETELDKWNFDYKILNASDLVSLKATVEVVLNKIL